MEQNEEIKNSSEVELDTDGVKDQSINVEELAEPVETELPKQEVDLGYTEPKPAGIEGIEVESILDFLKQVKVILNNTQLE